MTHKDIIKVGLRQLPLPGLVRARHRCKIEPNKIQRDGGLTNLTTGTY